MNGHALQSHGLAPAVAPNGMVATGQPLAVQTGVDILKAGGNAIDAAIAVNAMLGLVEPMSCGIGGDLFAIIWEAKSQTLFGLNASGRSPYRMSRSYCREQGLDEIPLKGPLSWSVPGCVDGWDVLLKRFGTKSYADLLGPAIEHAEKGFEVTPVIAGYWKGSESFDDPDFRKTYLPSGKVPEAGERLTNSYLAASYKAIVREGRDAFYRGEIARQLLEASRQKGGLFKRYDFEDHTSTWIDPVSVDYRGYTVWELPPNGQGIAALQILNILEGYDLNGIGHNSVDHLHYFIEAKKLAFEDRATYYADPAFAEIPVQELLSKRYAERQRERIDPRRAATRITPGDPKWANADTVYLTVVDRDRNAVSLIQSIYSGFGSAIVPGDLGFALQNRGNLFTLNENHLNRLEPHKRPFHTIIPGMVTRKGKPWLSFGVMGGDMQPQGHVQVLCNIIDFGLNVQEAGTVARARHDGSSTPRGDVMTDGGAVYLEEQIMAAAEGLKARGHNVAGSSGSYGGYQAIRIDEENGLLHGGSEPRKDGMALGY